MPPVTKETLEMVLNDLFPDAKKEGLNQFSGLFMDLQLKASNHEISTKPLDLRGMIGAIRTIRAGLSPRLAVRMGIVDQEF